MPRGKSRSKYPQLYEKLNARIAAENSESAKTGDQTGDPVPTGDPVHPQVPQVPEPAEPTGEPEPSSTEQPEPAPEPAPEPTAEQKRIAQLEQQLAALRAQLATASDSADGVAESEPPVVYESATQGADNVVIHFVDVAGFTALGHVWYRGQELEFAPGSQAHRDTCDRTGRSWVDLRDDPVAQEQRWGRVVFRSGPWPHRTLADAEVTFESLRSLTNDGTEVPAPSKQELATAAAAEARRKRAVPRLPQR